MHKVRSRFMVVTAVALGFAAASASAATPADLQKGFEAAARDAVPGFSGFSAQRGEQFFKARHGNDWSCTSCHTENPLGQGRHAKTGKTIAPLAPGANPLRFTDAASVEKWFRRNCNDVLSRTCTVREKGDVLQYLISLR
jgi:uncharacterized protein DUF1924